VELFLGFATAADRSLVITYFGVPDSWIEDDLRGALRTSGCPTPMSLLRTRRSHTTGHWSWRTGFGSAADAAAAVEIVIGTSLLETSSVEGPALRIDGP